MKIEICPIKIIKETRLEKHVFTLSHGELEFIVKHKALSSFEKLLWLLLASMSTENDDFSCDISYEALASKMEIACSSLIESLQNLEKMGFLKINTHAGGKQYHLSLPNAGLLYLRLSAKRETPQWLKKMRFQENKDMFMWW